MPFVIKVVISGLIVALVSELGKRFTLIAAILASLPFTSILAMIWLYHDTRDPQRISTLSYEVFWACLPSLIFFIALPLLLKTGMRFSLAMIAASAVMFLSYSLYVLIVRQWGVKV